ncbi:unnamed protein product [Effrenium voratum]|uniref:SbsA Ig-like domain-containing protein n=1 Tax=Effrenium voratum TaxID=2562239 RepID=A0AA36I882_9DINO|nr:unnamed protein product [Effrenium voratum]CAJ1420077.1 unnamed protein product [Effrenium voratum]
MALFSSHQWQDLAFRSPRRRLLQGLCCLLLLRRAASAKRMLQEEEELPEYEFDILPSDRLRVGIHEIVTGWFYVKGNFTLGSLGDVAYASREMLANACDSNLPTLLVARQDILTVSAPRVGLNMSFQILAPQGWAHYCVQALRFAGFGPTEPPFDTTAAPPIRRMMQASLEQNTVLDMDMETWVIDLGVSCSEWRVSYGQSESPAELLKRSLMPAQWLGMEEPSPCGSVAVKWTPSSSVKFPWEDQPCLAAPTPCICASIKTCRYLTHPSGGKRCASGWETTFDLSRVSCEDCPYQPDCPPTCEDAYTPCMCSFWNCTWDEGSNSCAQFDPEAGQLSCYLCARQSHCLGLTATHVEPPLWSYLGDDDVGWLINVTFNRLIRFGPLMDSEPSAVHFGCQSEAEAGQDPPVVVQFDLSMEYLHIREDVLVVDAHAVPNPLKLRFCQLTIYPGAIIDPYFIPFRGTWTSHWFMLGDTVAPDLLTLLPDNSARDIALDVTVRLGFSEHISLGPAINGSVVLVALGGQGFSSGPENELLQVFKADRLRMDGSILYLELGGLLKHDQFYSIGIGTDAVQDKVGNNFAGLPTGIYAFRTVPRDATVLKLSDGISAAAIATAAVFTVVLCAALAIGVLTLWRRRKRNAAVEPATEELDTDEFEGMKEMQDLETWTGTEDLEELLEDLKAVHHFTRPEAKEEEIQVVTYQPPLDDSYYATVAPPLSAESSTVLEPDMSVVHQARPQSAKVVLSEVVPPEVIEYYAFPPPWTAEELACPPSSPPALLEQLKAPVNPPQELVPILESDVGNASPPRSRPVSAHEGGRLLIRSLYESSRPTSAPKARRPQSAPSLRVQEKLLQSHGAVVFRECDSKLQSHDAHLDPRSRPQSASRLRSPSAAQLRPGSASRPQSAVRPSRPQSGLRAKTGRPQSASRMDSHARRRAARAKTAPLAAVEEPMALERSEQMETSTPNADSRNDSQTNQESSVAQAQGISESPKENGINLEELRQLGLVREMPAAITRDHRPRLSPNPRPQEESLAQESDLHSWETTLKRKVAVLQPEIAIDGDNEESASSPGGIGIPWTWQENLLEKRGSDVQAMSNLSPSHQSYLWEFQAPEVPRRKAADRQQGSPLARRHMALGIRSRSSMQRSTSIPSLPSRLDLDDDDDEEVEYIAEIVD